MCALLHPPQWSLKSTLFFWLAVAFLLMDSFVSSALHCGCGHLGRLSHGLRQGC